MNVLGRLMAISALVFVVGIDLVAQKPRKVTQNDIVKTLKSTKNLVALWDFKEQEGQEKISYGHSAFALKEMNGTLPRISEGPLSGYSTLFGNKAFLSLSNSAVGKLNIYGSGQGVTLIAWVKWTG